MPKKVQPNQPLERRGPLQARSLYKVGLMLEAAMQLLEQGDVSALTTNAVAAKAGVSIGSLYQYFKDKQALLDALVERELGEMSEKILQAMATVPMQPGDRIRQIVRAVLGSYGGRSDVHRRLIEHALTHKGGGSLSPLFTQLQQAFSSKGTPGPSDKSVVLSEAQAFVLTHAVAGVLRTLAASSVHPPLRGVEDALVMLVVSYVGSVQSSQSVSASSAKRPPMGRT